jgi:hypothetical protein
MVLEQAEALSPEGDPCVREGASAALDDEGLPSTADMLFDRAFERRGSHDRIPALPALERCELHGAMTLAQRLEDPQRIVERHCCLREYCR